MKMEENIRAILEANFAGFKEELIDNAVKSISELYYKPCPFSTKDGFCQFDDIAETIDVSDFTGRKKKDGDSNG